MTNHQITKRDKQIVQEAVLGEKSYSEIGFSCEPPISKQRVHQIIKKFHIKFDGRSLDGLPKFQNQKDRQSLAMKGKNKK